MIFIRNKDERDLVQRLRAIASGTQSGNSVEGFAAEILTLKREISDLTIQKSQKEEEFTRRERDLQHMIGLEKKRQEVELTQAKRDATLTVREEALKSEKEEFKRQLEFNSTRFKEHETFIDKTLQAILERLPSINVSVKKGR